ncbi:hypothetical protein TVAG_193060 [Trichomonas vaginalis G3]|uniref:Uncharacterized protein n=1 Tax=Trichomonas vaginalis (strain ATCC PRA-98 / G3) TaxID=412133 RepID=A2DH20_TRIV3|nr:RNA splicing [Trichomonas vaginalis G3]EAY20330.1 hypothetical protein TVAG_193060 [Trichomonas vaginalis G3]KAI5530681.1 RNA splicing [Trichomonas vaginalis G3]|eukprot:XP_001581316.1 hypothetical protein [Trichomonas vaginalis G3]
MFRALERHTQDIKADLFEFNNELLMHLQKNDQLNESNFPEIRDYPVSTDLQNKITITEDGDQEISFLSPVSAIDISWGRKNIVFGSYSSLFLSEIENLPSAQQINGSKTAGNQSYIRNVAYHPSDALIAFSGQLGSINLYDIQTLSTISTTKMHSSVVIGLGFTSDGSKLVTTSRDGIINVTDLVQSKIVKEIKVKINLTCMTMSKSDDYLAVGTEEGTIYLFDNRVQEGVQTIDAHYAQVICLATNNEGIIASRGKDKTCRLWDIRETISSTGCIASNADGLCSLDIYDNKLLSATESGDLKLYDLSTTFPLAKTKCLSRPIAVKYVPELNSLIYSTEDSKLHIEKIKAIEQQTDQ